MGDCRSGEWTTATVAQIAATSPRSIAIGPFGSALKSDTYTQDGIPVLRGQDIGNGHLLAENGLVFVPEQVAAKFPACLVGRGDLVFPHRGAIGRVGIVGDRTYLLSSSMMKLTCNSEIVDPGYVFYYFRGPGRAELLARASTVGTPGIGQPLQSLRGIVISFPSLDQQRAIAELLGALDDKIVANDRVLGIVDDLVGAEFSAAIGRGFTKVALGDAVEFHNRRRVPLSSRERQDKHGSVPYYGAAGRVDFVDQALFDEPLVLVGEDGTVIRSDSTPVVQYIWGPSWVNNHAHVITGTSISTETLRVAISRVNVAHLVTGAVQPKISMGNLKKLVLEIPTNIERLEEKVKASAGTARAISDENGILARTRDELLPLLMAGKIRVKDAERTVEGVV